MGKIYPYVFTFYNENILSMETSRQPKSAVTAMLLHTNFRKKKTIKNEHTNFDTSR